MLDVHIHMLDQQSYLKIDVRGNLSMALLSLDFSFKRNRIWNKGFSSRRRELAKSKHPCQCGNIFSSHPSADNVKPVPYNQLARVRWYLLCIRSYGQSKYYYLNIQIHLKRSNKIAFYIILIFWAVQGFCEIYKNV